jgi:hypothetical protein
VSTTGTRSGQGFLTRGVVAIKNYPSVTSFSLFLLLSFFQSGAAIGADSTDEVSNIEQACKSIDRSIQEKTLSSQALADVGSEETVQWKKFKSAKERYDGDWGGNSDIADAYFMGTTLVYVAASYANDSGDWKSYLHYYFRADGSVEKIESEYREFRGSSEQLSDLAEVVQLLETRYYDPNGNCIQQEGPDCLDLKTHKKLKDATNLEGPEKDGKTPFYTHIKKLPFYGILASETGKRRIIYHTAFEGKDADEALDDELHVIDMIQKDAEKNHIEIKEDPKNGKWVYTLVDGNRTKNLDGMTDAELWQECQKFFDLK